MLKFPPERIICLTEETVETLYLLGEEKRIVGVTGYAIRPKRVRKEKPRVGSFVSGKINKIRDLNPELILTFSDVQADLTKQLILEGFNVICFNQQSISEIYSMIKYLGCLVGKTSEANKLVKKIKLKIQLIKREKDIPRPKIYFEEWDDPHISATRWVSEIVEIAGGQDIFSAKSKQHKALKRAISSDEVIIKNPDIIFASWCGKKVNFQKIKERAGWDTISAIRTNSLFEIKSPIILQPGPAALTEGLLQIHGLIKDWRNRTAN